MPIADGRIKQSSHLPVRCLVLKLTNIAGTRSVAMVFRAVVFTFVPTAVELVLVCFLLARIFQPIIAIMVVATFAAYVLWTAQLTRAAAKVIYSDLCLLTQPYMSSCRPCSTSLLSVISKESLKLSQESTSMLHLLLL